MPSHNLTQQRLWVWLDPSIPAEREALHIWGEMGQHMTDRQRGDIVRHIMATALTNIFGSPNQEAASRQPAGDIQAAVANIRGGRTKAPRRPATRAPVQREPGKADAEAVPRQAAQPPAPVKPAEPRQTGSLVDLTDGQTGADGEAPPPKRKSNLIPMW